MATQEQIYWSNGTEAQPVPLKVKNTALFYECCRLRYVYEKAGATSVQWQELAERFQDAKGNAQSYLAEYCRRQAARAGRVQ